MPQITLQEVWERYPEAMVAWDRDCSHLHPFDSGTGCYFTWYWSLGDSLYVSVDVVHRDTGRPGTAIDWRDGKWQCFVMPEAMDPTHPCHAEARRLREERSRTDG